MLFIDADVRLAPWTIGAAVSELEGRSLGMLSLFGGWELKSFWEKVLVPVIGWFIRGAVDLALVNAVGGVGWAISHGDEWFAEHNRRTIERLKELL